MRTWSIYCLQTKPGWCGTIARIKCQVRIHNYYANPTGIVYILTGNRSLPSTTYQEGTSLAMVIIHTKCYPANFSQAAVLLTRCTVLTMLSKKKYIWHAGTQKDQMIRVFLFFPPLLIVRWRRSLCEQGSRQSVGTANCPLANSTGFCSVPASSSDGNLITPRAFHEQA